MALLCHVNLSFSVKSPFNGNKEAFMSRLMGSLLTVKRLFNNYLQLNGLILNIVKLDFDIVFLSIFFVTLQS